MWYNYVSPQVFIRNLETAWRNWPENDTSAFDAPSTAIHCHSNVRSILRAPSSSHVPNTYIAALQFKSEAAAATATTYSFSGWPALDFAWFEIASATRNSSLNWHCATIACYVLFVAEAKHITRIFSFFFSCALKLYFRLICIVTMIMWIFHCLFPLERSCGYETDIHLQ